MKKQSLFIGVLVAGLCVAGLAAAQSTVSFNPTSVSVAVGGSATVTVSGGTGTYYVGGNSNTGAVGVSQDNAVLTITGVGQGTASITICDMSHACNAFTVTVGSSTTSSGGLTFSPSNPSIGVGQTVTVTISGGGNAYYVSSNSSAGIMTYTLNGNTMVITGVLSGTANMQICSTTSVCGNMTLLVGSAATTSSSGGSSSGTTTLTFGTANPTVGVGQSINVSLTGGTGHFLLSNTDGSTVQATVTPGLLVLTGLKAGNVTISVCGSGAGCGTLPVTVGTTSSVTPTPTPTPTPSPTPITPPVVSPSPVASSGNLLAEIQTMRGQLAQILAAIQIMQTRLNQLAGSYTVAAPTVVTPPTAAASFSGTFTAFLDLNSTGPEVTALQKKLTEGGYYSGPITGTLGPLTQAALKKYQSANGLDPAGYVGPGTRALLNAQ